MKSELDVVKDVSSRLNQSGLAYMLTGSMAMNYYAQPRMTRDIDMVIALVGNDVKSLEQLFGGDYYMEPEAVAESIRRRSMFNLIHNESVIKVDFIIRKDDEYRLAEFQRRQKIRIADFETYIVSKEDLILSKLVWAGDSRSSVQLGDVKNLLRTGYDKEYLQKWAHKLKVRELLEECQSE